MDAGLPPKTLRTEQKSAELLVCQPGQDSPSPPTAPQIAVTVAQDFDGRDLGCERPVGPCWVSNACLQPRLNVQHYTCSQSLKSSKWFGPKITIGLRQVEIALMATEHPAITAAASAWLSSDPPTTRGLVLLGSFVSAVGWVHGMSLGSQWLLRRLRCIFLLPSNSSRTRGCVRNSERRPSSI